MRITKLVYKSIIENAEVVYDNCRFTNYDGSYIELVIAISDNDRSFIIVNADHNNVEYTFELVDHNNVEKLFASAVLKETCKYINNTHN